MRKCGVVIFGASVFEFYENLNNPRFKKSAEEFRRVLADPKILPDVEIETLDLYDQSLSVSDTLGKISEFVEKDHDDLIIYYCGHGIIGVRDEEYQILLRRSERLRSHTLLKPRDLMNGVKQLAFNKWVYFVLDACYSGSAVAGSETMDADGAEGVIVRDLRKAVAQGGTGTAVFTSAGRNSVALAKTEDETTLFTGAFIDCLRKGISDKSDAPRYSWQDVKDEIIRVTQARLGRDAPIPQLIGYNESAKDLTRVDYFSNSAFVEEPSVSPPPPSGDVYARFYELEWKTSLKGSTNIADLTDFINRSPPPPIEIREAARQRIDLLRGEEEKLNKASPANKDAQDRKRVDDPPPTRPSWQKIAAAICAIAMIGIVVWLISNNQGGSYHAETNDGAGYQRGRYSGSNGQVENQTPHTFDPHVNYDMRGGDIGSAEKQPDVGGCQASCNATSNCVAYSFDRRLGYCYLKSSVGMLWADGWSDTGVRADRSQASFATGERFCPFHNLPITGDRQNVGSQSRDSCEQACRSSSGCSAYTFDSSCVLYRRIAGKGPGGIIYVWTWDSC